MEGDHKHKILDKPFMPKYGTVFQVLLQLVVALLSLLEEIKPFPDRKMINLLTFDDLFPPLRLK